MSILYKPKEKQTISVDFKTLKNGKIQIDFTCDCGKFGTDEQLDGFILSPERLLNILQERKDIKDFEK